MPRADRPTVRRRRAAAGLVGAVALLSGVGAAVVPSVSAAEAGPAGDEIFGAYTASARANAVQVTYDAENLFPMSPILQFTVPEALATLGSGPTGYGLASLLYPGPLVADIGTVIALADDRAPEVPNYPVRQQAFYPTGPTEGSEGGDGGPLMQVETTQSSSEAIAHWSAAGADPVVDFGTVTSRSLAAVLDGQLVTRARSEVNDVVLLGGVVTIDSVVTDLVAVHDGEAGATSGRTRAQGVKFLGLDAVLTGDGLELVDASGDDDEGSDPTGGPLGGVADPLGQVTGPVNEGLAELLGQAGPNLDDVLAEAGITMQLMQPVETLEEGTASRSAGGLVIDFRYEGREQEGLVQLVNAIPPDLRQSLGPIPNPVNMLIENHIMGVALAPGAVSSMAFPLFEIDLPEFVAPVFDDLAAPAPPADAPLSSSPSTGGGTTSSVPGFSTPIPSPAQTTTSGSPGSTTRPVADATQSQRPIAAIMAGAVPAFVALLLAGAAPFFAAGSRKLADAALAPGTASCPFGLDRPSQPRE